MARTKQEARKAPRREEAVAQHIPGLEDDAEDGAEEDEDGDDGLQCWDMHDLLLATLREQRLLVSAVKNGTASHEVRRVDNRGSCGVCKVSGASMACVQCKVRLCRHTNCLNAHIGEGKGGTISDTSELKVSEDQGEKKVIRGRAQMDEDE